MIYNSDEIDMYPMTGIYSTDIKKLYQISSMKFLIEYVNITFKTIPKSGIIWTLTKLINIDGVFIK